VERRADGTATFLIDNPGSLTVDEHPFAVSVLRDLADAGIDVALVPHVLNGVLAKRLPPSQDVGNGRKEVVQLSRRHATPEVAGC
jgi:hypothetical protein